MRVHSDEHKAGQVYRDTVLADPAFYGKAEAVLRDELAFKSYQAMEEAKHVEEANGRIERAFTEGLGQLECIVPASVFFQFMVLYGRDCWDDADFLKSFIAKNPGMKPVSRSRQTMLVMPGRKGTTKDATGAKPRQESAGVRTGGLITP